ncbi:DUF192 domain-containing protein [Desertibacillus haloalkaliphilus]|uniref:DUF192 domain-containing protein n=1 Tax=Desertibacillus haloalkaliphilus TaxID=1328930 RepID=UPI001C259686|nr:DUF192 domain-containing protein [Desertibacillus haloalkaliphilus]MBU8908043.1 DUF192 domain-containing protein [Desertibacillus haloalkaliphilus]
MKIYTRTGEEIATDIRLRQAQTFSKRLKGLMFRHKPLVNEGIVLYPCNSIHMFFMFIAIDVIFLDHHNQVIKAVPNVKPWRVLLPVKGAQTTLEVPLQTIIRYNITNGDMITF